MDRHVVTVDAAGRALGTVETLQAHVAPVPHRAVAVLLVSPRGQLLLQRRADAKPHSANRWSNTCSGHPRPGEDDADAATRRLCEEMGIRCPLTAIGAVRYRVDVGEAQFEDELTELFVAEWTGHPRPDEREVSAWCWLGGDTLRQSLARTPGNYAAWLPVVLETTVALALLKPDLVPDGLRHFAGAWTGEAALRESRAAARKAVHVVGRDERRPWISPRRRNALRARSA